MLKVPSLHFTSFIITVLTLFLKMCYLQEKVASTSAGSWFQSLINLFRNEYFRISALSFVSLIILYNTKHFQCCLSAVAGFA